VEQFPWGGSPEQCHKRVNGEDAIHLPDASLCEKGGERRMLRRNFPGTIDHSL
jgi:hypothetical protein